MSFEPVRLAVIGAGNRSANIYRPLFDDLAPYIKITAVCDPVAEHADSYAASVGAKAYYDIKQLVKDRPMEAAVVITPVESHHSISVFLSENKIPNIVETSWCSTIRQADQMIAAARDNGVVTAVCENFFRFAIDRVASMLVREGAVGPVHRIYSYNDHTGYHNNSRWIHFAGAHPLSVQSFCHEMPTMEFTVEPNRHYLSETFLTRLFTFPEGFAVVDSCANIKGFLGRQSRPGLTEWQGERGTIVHQGLDGWQWRSFLKQCRPGRPSAVSAEIIYETPGERFTRAHVSGIDRDYEYVNPFVPKNICEHINKPFYGCAVMDELAEFASAVRLGTKLEFTPLDARMSLVMELAANESAALGGRSIDLVSPPEFAAEAEAEAALREQFHVDPYDIEAMLAISYPRK